MRKVKAILPTRVRHHWIRFFSSRKDVRSATIFGSRARGDAESRSDIDVSISAPDISDREWLEISFFLKDNTPSLLPVDVVRWESSTPTLRKKIRKEGRLIYERS